MDPSKTIIFIITITIKDVLFWFIFILFCQNYLLSRKLQSLAKSGFFFSPLCDIFSALLSCFWEYLRIFVCVSLQREQFTNCFSSSTTLRLANHLKVTRILFFPHTRGIITETFVCDFVWLVHCHLPTHIFLIQ